MIKMAIRNVTAKVNLFRKSSLTYLLCFIGTVCQRYQLLYHITAG